MKKQRNNSIGLFSIGTVIFGLGLFVSYGIAIFIGLIMMVAGLLPPTAKETEEEDGQI